MILKLILFSIFIAFIVPLISAKLFEKLIKYEVDEELEEEESKEKLANFGLLCKVFKESLRDWHCTFFLYIPLYLIVSQFHNIWLLVVWWIGAIIVGITLLCMLPFIVFVPHDVYCLIFSSKERKKGIGYVVLVEIIRIFEILIDIVLLLYLYPVKG